MNSHVNKKFVIKISYLEIYNEHVIDLLNDQQTQLMIVEDPVRGVFVPELREIEVEHPDELIDLIVDGNIKSKVENHLIQGWSPEQISARFEQELNLKINYKTPLSVNPHQPPKIEDSCAIKGAARHQALRARRVFCWFDEWFSSAMGSKRCWLKCWTTGTTTPSPKR